MNRKNIVINCKKNVKKQQFEGVFDIWVLVVLSINSTCLFMLFCRKKESQSGRKSSFGDLVKEQLTICIKKGKTDC